MRFTSRVLLVLFLGLGLGVGCSSDLGNSGVRREQRSLSPRYENAGLGFDPGVRLSQPITGMKVAGAAIPTLAGDLGVAFVAFATKAKANDADGNGTSLDRNTPAPTDTNDADDVFVAAVVQVERIVNGRPQPAAFTQGLATVFRDDRCVRCHSFHYPGGWREAGHPGNLQKGSNEGCEVCHRDADSLTAGSTRPPTLLWEAPDAPQSAPKPQDFRGKSDRELYELVLTKPNPKDHLRSDDKILWALAHGRVPFQGRAPGGSVPIELSQWDDLVEAWAMDSAFDFSTDKAVRDVVLVSHRASGDGAGNGASTTPSVAYEPNPAYQPTNPEVAPAGWVLVAFASDARDLVAGVAATHRDVYRARVAVRIGRDQSINLVAEPANTLLVSGTPPNASQGGNGDSFEPEVGGVGRTIAFTSRATNLVSPFVDGNGAAASDVFMRDVDAGATILVSAAMGLPARSGNAESRGPSAASIGNVFAFESAASDLVGGDTNGRRDVFYARTDARPVTIARASLNSAGVEATGGDASGASVWLDGANNEVFVAFESTADRLDLAAGAAVAPGAYLFRSVGTPSLLRLGRPSLGATRAPKIDPEGRRVVFLSAAPDLDALRADGNGLDDVFSFNLESYRSSGGTAIGYLRHSVAVTGRDATGASSAPVIAGFLTPARTFQNDLLVGFTTQATNLGRSPNTDVVLQFVIDRSTPRTVAEFNGTPKEGQVPLPVTFTDLSNNATTWSWDFGDGGRSSERNPSYTYSRAGLYTVSLTVTGPGGTSLREKPAYIRGNARPRTWSEIYTGVGPGGLRNGELCTNCHNATLPMTRPFDMRGAVTARNNLVNVPSVRCLMQVRVVPGNVAESQLIKVMLSTSCFMHSGGGGTPELVLALTEWINGGALP